MHGFLLVNALYEWNVTKRNISVHFNVFGK